MTAHVETISKITSLAQHGNDMSGSTVKGPQDETKRFDAFTLHAFSHFPNPPVLPAEWTLD